MSRLKDIRNQKDVTQHELAEAVDVDRSWISKIESGDDTAPDWLALKIAAALGTTTRKLFKRVPQYHKRYRVKK